MRQLAILAVILVCLRPTLVHAWSATGHHVIAVIAFDQLSKSTQSELMRLLAAHPDFGKRFGAPRGITNPDAVDRWRIGVAGCWPDIVRGSDADRPTWHYELGASLTIGDETKVSVPQSPGPLPTDATLQTQELYLSQAYELCLRVLADNSQADSDRAIALCWVIHTLADGHQPCHAGSLYAPNIFPDGDRGGNSIRMGRGNLHSTWDNLLGGNARPSDVQRRVVELKSDRETISRVEEILETESERDDWIAPSLWLRESQVAARKAVYTPEVLEAVSLAMRGVSDRVNIRELSDDYYAVAGRVARTRAIEAGYRLAVALENALGQASK